MSQQVDYRFDGFRVDRARRLLFGPDGQPISLKPKVFDVLLYLVERPGELVPKQALLDAVWPHVVVEENNLNKAISTLRQVFGETRDEHRFVVTEPGRGYRFVARVEAVGEAPGAASAPGVRNGSIGVSEPRDSGNTTGSTPPLRPSDVPRPKRFASRLLIYSLAGAALLLVALSAANDYWRGLPIRDRVTASDASLAAETPFTYTILAPAGSTFGFAPADPLPALSPDGRQLAFIAAWKSAPVVWIQTLGNPDARPLVGTEGADYMPPIWSPDGTFIAFATEGGLKRIATTGSGAPTEIVAIDGIPAGGTWSADGTIIFGGSSGLSSASANGGAARPLTSIDATHGESSHRSPVMLPDGRRFLYLVLGSQEDHVGLYLGSLDDSTMKVQLLTATSNAGLGLDAAGRWRVLFVRDSALLAQPFDAERGVPVGDPVRIATPVDVAPTSRYAAFAVSGRTLVYRPRFAPSNTMVFIDRERGGIRGDIVGAESRRWRFPALSRDGTKLAALRVDESDLAGLWYFDLRSGDRRLLARGSWLGKRPDGALMSAWTPESDAVVYSWAQPGGWVIYRQSLDRIAADRVLDGRPPAGKRVRDVTADFVLFQDEKFEPWVLPLAGDGQPYRLHIEGAKTHARLSADGRWLAYTLREAGTPYVYVSPFPELSMRWRVSPAGGSDPQWRADGRELFYYSEAARMLMSVAVEPGEVFRFDAPVPLFRASLDGTSRAFGSAYAPTPDGQRFIVIEDDGKEPQLTAILYSTDRR